MNQLAKVWRGPNKKTQLSTAAFPVGIVPGGMLHTFLLGLWQLARLLLLVQLLGTSVLLLDVARLNMGFAVPWWLEWSIIMLCN